MGFEPMTHRFRLVLPIDVVSVEASCLSLMPAFLAPVAPEAAEATGLDPPLTALVGDEIGTCLTVIVVPEGMLLVKLSLLALPPVEEEEEASDGLFLVIDVSAFLTVSPPIGLGVDSCFFLAKLSTIAVMFNC